MIYKLLRLKCQGLIVYPLSLPSNTYNNNSVFMKNIFHFNTYYLMKV